MATSSPTTDAPPLPPHGSLFSDQMAAAVMAAIEKLEEGLQHEILRLLRNRLLYPDARSGDHARELARGVAALRDAAELLLFEAGDAGIADPPKLSERQYKRLRAEWPDLGWPAESVIRKVVGGGSWNAALRRAYLEADDDGDTSGVERRAFAWEEIEAGIRDFFDDLRAIGIPHPDPTENAFIHWAKRPDVASRPGRRPSTKVPFQRFGGFEACKAAMLAGDGPPSPEEIKRRLEQNARLRRRGHRYSEADVKAALREVAGELGEVPSAKQYQVTRDLILDQAKARGDKGKALPHYNLINLRFRSWDRALAAAGLTPFDPVRADEGHGMVGVAPGPRRRYSDEDIFGSMRAAYEVKGKPFTIPAYSAWRQEREQRGDDGRRIPAYGTIADRFRHEPEGPWKVACDRALPPGWDTP